MVCQLNLRVLCCLQDPALVLFNFCCYECKFKLVLCTRLLFFPHFNQRKRGEKQNKGSIPVKSTGLKFLVALHPSPASCWQWTPSSFWDFKQADESSASQRLIFLTYI